MTTGNFQRGAPRLTRRKKWGFDSPHRVQLHNITSKSGHTLSIVYGQICVQLPALSLW